ncbi:MAG: 50S ribosomal protein L3 N(5)-glutamine methyltransferase [Brachymonas sp.]|nr:50S ribosomal protein L3 N(5)-glutamine methyltransferase [Brachymonas sp.]
MRTLVEQQARRLDQAGVAFGHGTHNAFDEAAWLVLWRLGLPLDSDLDDPALPAPDAAQIMAVAALIDERIASRKPAAYLTREAWLQGVPFYVDERTIVPRSLIAEPLAEGAIDDLLGYEPAQVLDLCTGNGSLAVLAALAWPQAHVDAADISPDALAVAAINVDQHGLQERIRLIESDGLAQCQGPYDLILCNPPYVNAASMAALPAEFKAEPALALAGGEDGMDFVRSLLRQASSCLHPEGVLVLEIGHEAAHFESAFPELQPVWLITSAGDEQVLLLRASDLD